LRRAGAVDGAKPWESLEARRLLKALRSRAIPFGAQEASRMTTNAPNHDPALSTPAARIDRVRRIAAEVAAPAASSVDREARFPRESIDALREARLLSAYVPARHGGYGAGVVELASMCETLGASCASSAMVFAMHQIQVACLVRHGLGASFFDGYLAKMIRGQRLIASVTSEAGVGGSVRTSISPIQRDAEGCTLRKDGTVVSYGESAEDLLITVRRAPDAAPNDQALVLVGKSQCKMDRTGSWDTFGMRGTCSPGYVITARFAEEQIVPAPFGEISSHTMLPFAHVLWGSLWLGIANDAVARARKYVRGVARQMPGQTPPSALRLSEVSAQLLVMRSLVHDAARRYEAVLGAGDRGELSSVGFALAMNELKIQASQLVVDIVTRALRVCGTAGYRNDHELSLTRHLRDAHSAALMIGNDRIHASNAALQLAYKDDA
jgi:acyl-CoA dehydrogenase